MKKKIVILAFNFGTAGKHVNGPGICLYNFYNFLKKEHPDIDIKVFTKLYAKDRFSCKDVFSLNDKSILLESIKNADIVHHWSGLGSEYSEILLIAKKASKKLVIGPNVIDGSMPVAESDYLKNSFFDYFITVNENLKFSLSKGYNIPVEKIGILMVGPDLNLWRPTDYCNNKVLWKGNSRHFVKDIEFGFKIAKKLKQYEFDFLGHPSPYDYFNHIPEAKNYKLYFSTSLSETMGMGLAEQWAAGIPSVTHPKIYLHGVNYQTGIITNRDVDSYCDAIVEIMENEYLYESLSSGSRLFAESFFSSEKICNEYFNIIQEG